jgi:hypothetical protein
MIWIIVNRLTTTTVRGVFDCPLTLYFTSRAKAETYMNTNCGGMGYEIMSLNLAD